MHSYLTAAFRSTKNKKGRRQLSQSGDVPVWSGVKLHRHRLGAW